MIALIKILSILFLFMLIARMEIMINYRKLTNKEKHIKFNNMKSRCSAAYQKQNPRYEGVSMWEKWLEDKHNTFFTWLDENYYEVDGEQMDIDKDILQYGNKQYHPDFCLIVPHSVNVFYENIEVGKTNISRNSKTDKYSVKVTDMGNDFRMDNLDTYNDALDAYCTIKKTILLTKAETLKAQIPEIVYFAMINTDIKKINQKYYESGREEK